MAAAPVLPTSPESTPQPAPLSQAARIIDTFIAPTKTFTDLRRSAAWWAPFLLMVIVSTAFIYVAGQKIGFRKITENQMQSQPKAQERLDRLPPDQREEQLDRAAKFTGVLGYAFPVITLLIWLVIAALMFGTFRFGAGAEVSFKASFAVVAYGQLPLLLKSLLAILTVVAGISPDSFSFQNPIATNPGYFMNPGDSPFLYSLATQLDIFAIWMLVLNAIGFTCVSKVKRGTSFAIVFGWWVVFCLALAGLAGGLA